MMASLELDVNISGVVAGISTLKNRLRRFFLMIVWFIGDFHATG